MPRKSLRVVGHRDTVSQIITLLKQRRPKDDTKGTYDISRSTEAFASQVKYFIKTGLQPIDDNIIGIPFGRITEIFGPENCGKTAYAWLACAQALTNRQVFEKTDHGLVQIPDDAEVIGLYVDAEGSMDDNPVMEVNGQRVDCIISNCDRIDHMFKLVEGVIDDISAISKKDKKLRFLVVVVDTVAALASKEELQADWDKDDFPRQPKFIRRGFRIIARKLIRKNVALICINQVGDKFKKPAQGGGPPMPMTPDDEFVVSGGKALAYWSRLRLFFWKANENYKLVAKAGSSAGFIGGFYVKKINQGPKPKTQGRFIMLFKGNERVSAGLNNLLSKLEHMLYMKVAERNKEGEISFKFKKYRVPMTTFGSDDVKEASTLEDNEDDDDASSSKNPVIDDRISFIDFYENHKVDVDALYAKAIELTQRVEGIDPTAEFEDEDADEEPDDVDEEEAKPARSKRRKRQSIDDE